MIRIYGMHTCPDCACIEEQVRDNDGYEIIDIGEHVRNLKAFLRLRDSSLVFDEARRNGSIGIPCFVLEDGRITLSPEEAGLHRLTPEPRKKHREEDDTVTFSGRLDITVTSADDDEKKGSSGS